MIRKLPNFLMLISLFVLLLGMNTAKAQTDPSLLFAKYDASGNYVWAKSIGGTGSDQGNSLALDGSKTPKYKKLTIIQYLFIIIN